MRFYDKAFESNFEELITYYPRFYRDVFEMVEILKAHGRIADELEGNVEQTYLNCFIDYADERTISELEKFLMIGLNKARSLEERRRLVKSYFVGFGKVSASMLEEMIQSYTGAAVATKFEPGDEQGNNYLYIDFQRGNEPTLYMSDILTLLTKKIPAHIAWEASVTYRYPVGIDVSRRHYKFDYELCGTKPETAKLGMYAKIVSVAEAEFSNHKTTYQRPAAEELFTGTTPDTSTIGSLIAAKSIIEAKRENYTSNYKTASEEAQEAGEWPNAVALGRTNEINTEAGVSVSSYGVDYKFCGTGMAQG